MTLPVMRTDKHYCQRKKQTPRLSPTCKRLKHDNCFVLSCVCPCHQEQK